MATSGSAAQSEGAGVTSGGVSLDLETARKKLAKVIADWRSAADGADAADAADAQPEREAWRKIDALAVIVDSADDEEESASNRNEAFVQWLIGAQVPESLLVVSRTNGVWLAASAKKLQLLKPLAALAREGGSFLLTRDRTEATDKEITAKIIQQLQQDVGCEKPTVGTLEAPAARGVFAGAWAAALKDGAATSSVDLPVAVETAVRTPEELALMDCAAAVTTAVVRSQLIGAIERVLDSNTRTSHAEIADTAEGLLKNEKQMHKLKEKWKVTDPSEIEIIHANVQSGGPFELRATAEASAAPLSQGGGPILVTAGARYGDLIANIARTLLINGNEAEKSLYKFSQKVHAFALSKLTAGRSMRSVFEAVASFVGTERSSLSPFLLRSLGHVIGLEFKDAQLCLNAKNQNVVIRPNMVFNLSVGFNLNPEQVKQVFPNSKNPRHAAVWIADTVRVTETGNTVLTASLSSEVHHISYELDEEEAEDGKAPEAAARRGDSEKDQSKAVVSADILKNADRMILKDRLRRRKHELNEEENSTRDAQQRELRATKLRNLERRLKAGGFFGGAAKKESKKLDTVRSFADPNEFPRDIRQTHRLFLDPRSECLFVPIKGVMIPFHASTIKNLAVSSADEGGTAVLRINFQVPGSQTMTSAGQENPLPDVHTAKGLFIKELTLRSKEARRVQGLVRTWKDMSKLARERDQTSDVVADQEKLQLNRSGRRVLLRDLMIRPNMHRARKIIGMLEAHSNGLRFTVNTRQQTADVVDIIYSNIKHAIFQPCEKSLIVLVHFHLKSSILVGKKKTQDVQFFTEAGTQMDDLDSRRNRSNHDPDEAMEEMRERESRKRINGEFKRFVGEVHELSKITFDIPDRALHFFGVPGKSSVEILPTNSCLVHLVEWPPFVLPLSDVELVSFERVQHGLRNFDMVFVFSDFGKPTKKIDCIPVEHLDVIKKWLCELNIVYYEGRQNLNWNAIMKQIKEAPEDFVQDGGFDIFLGTGTADDNGNSSDDEDAVDGDSEYSIDDEDEESDFDEDSEASGSEESSLASESSGAETQSVDSEEEEGLSWDELEEQAKKDDRRRHNEDSEEERKKRRRHK
eukprot:GHVT01096307.1.p1 GENE.GHVT01096307.1~~GHVT01096307.1.p1  ORF type:complete len:1094 (+),score=278.86 GHVT01096307.1:239-3520(+)